MKRCASVIAPSASSVRPASSSLPRRRSSARQRGDGAREGQSRGEQFGGLLPRVSYGRPRFGRAEDGRRRPRARVPPARRTAAGGPRAPRARRSTRRRRRRRADRHLRVGARERDGAQQVARAGEHDDLAAPTCARARSRSARRPPTAVARLDAARSGAPARPGAGSIGFGKRTALWAISRARRVDDRRRAAVVVRERDALQPGVGAIELEHPPHRRAPEPVQRLVVVADGEQRVLRRGQDADQQLLRGLDVLVLVDEHVLEAALPAGADARVARAARGRRSSTRSSKSSKSCRPAALVERVDAGDRLAVALDELGRTRCVAAVRA